MRRSISAAVLVLASSMVAAGQDVLPPVQPRPASQQPSHPPADCDDTPVKAPAAPPVRRVVPSEQQAAPAAPVRKVSGSITSKSLANLQATADGRSYPDFKSALDATRVAVVRMAGSERALVERTLPVYTDLQEIWKYEEASPIGAFFDEQTLPGTYEHLARAYPGYAAAIRDQRVTANDHRTLYPSEETRHFLAREAKRVTGGAVSGPAPLLTTVEPYRKPAGQPRTGSGKADSARHTTASPSRKPASTKKAASAHAKTRSHATSTHKKPVIKPAGTSSHHKATSSAAPTSAHTKHVPATSPRSALKQSALSHQAEKTAKSSQPQARTTTASVSQTTTQSHPTTTHPAVVTPPKQTSSTARSGVHAPATPAVSSSTPPSSSTHAPVTVARVPAPSVPSTVTTGTSATAIPLPPSTTPSTTPSMATPPPIAQEPAPSSSQQTSTTRTETAATSTSASTTGATSVPEAGQPSTVRLILFVVLALISLGALVAMIRATREPADHERDEKSDPPDQGPADSNSENDSRVYPINRNRKK